MPDSWKTLNIAQNSGRLYRDCGVPAAGTRPTLTNGEPSVGTHMGATRAGSRVLIKPTLTAFNVDEFRAPIARNLDAVNMGISSELVGVTDQELAAFLLPGVATRSTGFGYDYMTIGSKPIAYSACMLTFQLIEDVTKYGWFMIYQALNDAGVEFAVARKELGFTPVSLVGTEITSRTSTDTLGQVGKQI
jgi:hypothetical protein